MFIDRLLTLVAASLLVSAPAVAKTYELRYIARVQPDAGTVRVEVRLEGERLPSKVVLHSEAGRHRAFASRDELVTEGDRVTWRPQGQRATLSYDFVVNHERAPHRYDSLMTADWA